MASDPFATAFGDDDENDTAIENVDTAPLDTAAVAGVHIEDGRAPPTPQRMTENGVLSFHSGTEHALLLFVQQAVKSFMSSSSDHDQQQHNNWRQVVLHAIDTFCLDRHWMMHVGPDKGCIVQDFLKKQIIQRDPQQQNHTYNIVELGTYCGYSTIRMADTLLQHHQIVPKFHIHTIDINAQSQNIAKQLIQLAGLQKYVSFILRESTKVDHPTSVSFTRQLTDSILRQTTEGRSSDTTGDVDKRIDFLFVDHAKELYLSDLQLLETSGFIRQGTAVAADNVVFFQLSDYCTHMSTRETQGMVHTELVNNNVYLEYVPPSAENNELRDGLELTVYLEDPTSATN